MWWLYTHQDVIYIELKEEMLSAVVSKYPSWAIPS